MPKPADFEDAHRRHWTDAKFLYRDRRLASADRLYGLSVECGLKAVMKTFGMRVDKQGSPKDRTYMAHMPELWERFTNFAAGRGRKRYLEGMAAIGDAFSDWAIADRYAHRETFQSADVDKHRKAACRLYVRIQHLARGR